MKAIIHFIRLSILTVLVLAGCIASTQAQVVSIPDSGLNAAIREALPLNPLTLAPFTFSIRNTNGLNRRYDYIFPNRLHGNPPCAS